ncbi:tryptophan 2,3-dioxygenase family protein [Streptomyces sp. CB03234]|uniref:tryptophan 2,3-dioxygenase family protein n=1 Tax=Streptomyces sp. (strain CB03234) TaxID=1703937 RepID=UPI002379C819|nr:tryptophan 2,3-dioxygenase family protein [Streptomyces sp. CB03234]
MTTPASRANPRRSPPPCAECSPERHERRPGNRDVERLMTAFSYSDYLRTDTLLSLQRTRTPPTADRAVLLAEHFFIVAHQSCELWLKQVVADLEAVAGTLSSASGAEDLELSAEYLQRASEVLRVLHDQVIVLERLPLRHFAAFRPYLGTASGAQSEQFRTLARLIGDERRTGTLYEAFATAVTRLGTTVAEVCRRGTGAGALHRVAEGLLDIGNGYWRWKVAHLGLTSKMLGGRPGTGATDGVDHLLRRITQPFSELRTHREQVHAPLAQSAG